MTQKKKATESKSSSKPTHKVKGVQRSTDTNLGWIERDYPQLEEWRKLAVEWLKGETRSIDHKLKALVAFFERYLIQRGLPLEPHVFLARNTVLPDFYKTTFPDSLSGNRYNNAIHNFLNFVLLSKFSEEGDNGAPVVSPVFHNPLPWMSNARMPKRNESVHSPLPYGYIDELRQMLAAGPHFRDWLLAQNLMGDRTRKEWPHCWQLVRSGRRTNQPWRPGLRVASSQIPYKRLSQWRSA